MVHKPLDFISRRSGRLYFDIQSIAPMVQVLLEDFSTCFQWTDRQCSTAKEEVEQALHQAKNFT